jgi:NADH dehydrogenase (ubiquinone) Fe-S protein 3
MTSQLILSKSFVFPFILFSVQKAESILVVLSTHLFFSIQCLKNHINYRYTLLSCISGVDFNSSNYRFAVVYDLISIDFNQRIRVKTFLKEGQLMASITSIFLNANWWEREIWDFFGIFFNQNLDLRRILTDYGFEGFPMRKDFPLSGYFELSYNSNKKRVVSNLVELSQEHRLFNSESSI